VDTPLAVAESRDPKGLFRKARRGELFNFTGVDSPYEQPADPELRIETTQTLPEDAADAIIAMLPGRAG
jgi:bifunctional enzyme CysN/CysC